MPNININAYDKLSTAFNYAQQIKNDPHARGGDSVVHLQGGNQLTCNYSAADAPRGILNLASRNQDKKDLNNATDNDGSYAKYEMEIKISAADMEKFSNADWSQCDTAEATRLEEGHEADRFQKAADKIVGDYKFTGSVNATMKIHVNALYEQETIYRRNNP